MYAIYLLLYRLFQAVWRLSLRGLLMLHPVSVKATFMAVAEKLPICFSLRRFAKQLVNREQVR